MARREAFVTIDAEGRDKGKVFKLTEMPAAQAERWAIRAFLALANAGVDLPEDVATSGMAGIAVVGIRALGKLKWADAEPLLDEMMLCVSACPQPDNRTVVTGLFPDSIEEISTRLRLRKEVFLLHTGFSLPAAPSTSA
ncbi:MAG TPA: hypothetical protein VF453_06565 [Burkholderiaceae bacterium]